MHEQHNTQTNELTINKEVTEKWETDMSNPNNKKTHMNIKKKKHEPHLNQIKQPMK